MQTITLDTHKFVTLLKSKGFTAEQAEGLVEAVKEIDASELVTKKDLQVELHKLRADLLKQIFSMLAGQLALFIAIMALLLDLI